MITTPTFAVSGLITQYGALFDVSVTLEQLTDVVLNLLLVQHSNEQLPVVCENNMFARFSFQIQIVVVLLVRIMLVTRKTYISYLRLYLPCLCVNFIGK